MSPLICFIGALNPINALNNRNKLLTIQILKQEYRYQNLRTTYLRCYRGHSDFISKYCVGLKTLPYEGISIPEFLCGLGFKFRRIVSNIVFVFFVFFFRNNSKSMSIATN